LHGFSLSKIVEPQCQMQNCIVTESSLKSSVQWMLIFKHLVCMSATKTELSAMHRSLVTLLQCSCHMKIKYSTSRLLARTTSMLAVTNSRS
jgi:hypothetical protein